MALRDHLDVMIVDDMSTSRGLIAQAVDHMGIRHIRTANSGKEALSSLSQKPAQLVICDYFMPDMNGMQVLRRLKRHKTGRATKFILLTCAAQSEIKERGPKFKLDKYLQKPLNPADLHRCIEEVVGRL